VKDVLAGVVAGDYWPLYQEVVSFVVNHYSRIMEDQNVWQNIPE
jgi:hypothetical protein